MSETQVNYQADPSHGLEYEWTEDMGVMQHIDSTSEYQTTEVDLEREAKLRVMLYAGIKCVVQSRPNAFAKHEVHLQEGQYGRPIERDSPLYQDVLDTVRRNGSMEMPDVSLVMNAVMEVSQIGWRAYRTERILEETQRRLLGT